MSSRLYSTQAECVCESRCLNLDTWKPSQELLCCVMQQHNKHVVAAAVPTARNSLGHSHFTPNIAGAAVLSVQ